VPRREQRGNEGIIANRIVADVVAVGRRATARKNVVIQSERRTELLAAVRALQRSIASLKLASPARTTLRDEVQKVEASVKAKTLEKPKLLGMLETIANQVKSLGALGGGAVAVFESIKKISDLLH
jgi:hypothetical protein